ncbi:Coatomer subunit beta [Entamoeba marina]
MEQPYIIYNQYNQARVDDIEVLLSKEDNDKILALQQLISTHLNDEPHPELLMSVIRYALPSPNHTVKRLFLMYLTIIPRVDEHGKLLPELILAINSLLQDLSHPNEYIRTLVLKFLIRVPELEILQPLVQGIYSNLTASSSLVRRHCYTLIAHVWNISNDLIPNAPQALQDSLKKERDTAAKRSALRALLRTSPSDGLTYLLGKTKQYTPNDPQTQLDYLRSIRALSSTTPQHRGTYANFCVQHLNSDYLPLAFESACVLLTVTTSPAAVRAAVRSMIDIAVNSSDVNVKISAIERVSTACMTHPRVAKTLVTDILRGLQITSLVVRSRVVDVAVDITTPSGAVEVATRLRKELRVTDSKYQSVIVKALIHCATLNPREISPFFLEILSDSPPAPVLRDVITFIRNETAGSGDVDETYVNNILKALRTQLSELPDTVLGDALWLIARFSTEKDVVDNFEKINEMVDKIIMLNNALIGGFVTAIVRLALIARKLENKISNKITARALLSLLTIVKRTSGDAVLRAKQGISVVSSNDTKVYKAALDDIKTKKEEVKVVEKGIDIEEEISISVFGDQQESIREKSTDTEELEGFKNVVQLSGYSDPLYMEASLHLSSLHINVDCLVVNQTTSTLQNIAVQLVPMSPGLTVSNTPQPLTLGAGEFAHMNFNVAVQGTSSGVIAGYVNYDVVGKAVTTGSSDAHMVLNNIAVEALDCIKPSMIESDDFQKKWSYYEYENRIVVETAMTDLSAFVDAISEDAHLFLFSDDIGFLSANLYATTVFGDDVLANISIELSEGKIVGCVRIRAESQAVAVALGDRVLLIQKRKKVKEH